MDQLYLLWFLSISMLIGSFVSGLVPMAFKLTDSKSRLLALLGSGILVGTALSIIIPEGIDALYGQVQQQTHLTSGNSINRVTPKIHSDAPDSDKSQSSSHNVQIDNISESSSIDPHSKSFYIGISLIVGFVLMLLIDQFSIYQGGSEHSHSHRLKSTSTSSSRPLNPHSYTLANQEDSDNIDIVQGDDEIDHETISENDYSKSTNEATNKHSTTANHQQRIANNETGNSNVNHTGVQMTSSAVVDPLRYYNHSRYINHRGIKTTKVTPTLGLVIHAAADGIALGAAATTSHQEIEMLIFFAIMLHKAPAAFSLVVLLLHRGLKPPTIRRHLLAFSLSAPIAALVSYYGLSQSGKEALRRNNATGIAMLFSAGTFLYVATVHVLPDLIHNKLLSKRELLSLVGGAFLPFMLARTM